MITLRRSAERGHFDHGWLDTYHTFSFDRYVDPRHMSFRHLRVINEDRVAPGAGFPMHPHRNMEIVTYVLSGALEHRDGMGNAGIIRPGEVQKMTAGRGITHSEANPSADEPVHLLQIWILSERNNLEPDYEQITLDQAAMTDNLLLIGSRSGGNDIVTIYQDVNLYAGRLNAGKTIDHELPAGRHVWLQLAGGVLQLNGHLLQSGDGAAVSEETLLHLRAESAAEFLLFDMS